jgi:hypothetical protein
LRPLHQSLSIFVASLAPLQGVAVAVQEAVAAVREAELE